MRASGPWARSLELDVEDHRAEQQREVREREEVQPQRAAAVGAAIQHDRAGDEQPAEHER